MSRRVEPVDMEPEAPGSPARQQVATMRDVAVASGVSQSTVSRVLTGTRTVVPIAAETRERVLETARRLGYRPNPLARGLRGARTMLLGVIVRDILDPFFSGAIEAVSIEAARRGYNVVLGHAHGRAHEAIELWGVLEARHCDGIILLGDMRDQPRLIDDLRTESMPVVALWQGASASDIPSVDVDNRTGVEAVLAHLAGLGHRRIAFVAGRRLGDIRDREEAYRASQAARGEEAVVELVPNDLAGGIAASARLLGAHRPPSAIVASTDVLALGVLHGVHQLGLRVPDDLSVTGFDDIPFAAAAIPALTTVRMPVREMVARAVALVLDGDAPRGVDARAHPVLQPTLVVRSSTGPAPADADPAEG